MATYHSLLRKSPYIRDLYGTYLRESVAAAQVSEDIRDTYDGAIADKCRFDEPRQRQTNKNVEDVTADTI